MKNRVLPPWKNLWLILCLGTALHDGAFAQCTNNLSVRTYDTLITGSGYGTYNLNFPKWNSDSGLLVSVKISAVVNLQYGFSLKNVDTQTGTYGLWVGREDYFTSPALSTAYDNIQEQKIGTYPLNPGDLVSMSPFAFLSNYANVDSISGNTAPFLGSGLVSFVYSPITYTNIHASNNASYSYHATASEQTHFSLSYLYCTSGVLASVLTSFTASLWDPASVQLNWSSTGEEKNRVYEVQRSRDGLSFTTIGSQAAEAAGIGTADYAFTDRLTTSYGPGSPGTAGSLPGKWYYRLRIVDAASVSYSPIRSVNIGPDGQNKMIVFPNPASDHINVLLPAGTPGDWLVNIRAADGRLVQSANFFHSNNLPIFFHQNLSPGIYFIRVTDQQGRNGRVASFRVDPR